MADSLGSATRTSELREKKPQQLDTPEARNERVKLYAMRANGKRDLWTGDPLNLDSEADEDDE